MYGSHEGQSPSEPSRPLCFKNYFADVQHSILVNKITVHIHSSSWLQVRILSKRIVALNQSLNADVLVSRYNNT